VWLATFLAVVWTAVVFVATWRTRNDEKPPKKVPGLALYLNEESIRQLAGTYVGALRREVEVRTGVKRGVFGWLFRWGANYESEHQTVTKYIEISEPADVVGVVLDGLEAANALVHVDLRKGEVLRNRALASFIHGNGDRATTRLAGMGRYVLVEGDFTLVSSTGDTAVFTIRYGVRGEQKKVPTVRLDCLDHGVRAKEIPEQEFAGSCLGKVQTWRADTGELLILPVAVFQ
jgi:hypothetical protein